MSNDAITGLPTAGQKQLLTIEQVREQFKPNRIAEVTVDNDDGSQTILAFKAPGLMVYRRFMEQKDQNEITATINLIVSCCLTHGLKEITAILDQGDLGMMATAAGEIAALMKAGVGATKKG